MYIIVYHPAHQAAAIEMHQKMAEMMIAAEMCPSDFAPQTDSDGNPCYWLLNDDSNKAVQVYWDSRSVL
jgi:hypothetical protein